MIVNGRTEFVGSDKARGRKALDDAAKETSDISITSGGKARAMIKAKPAECVDVTLRVPAGIKPERARLVIYAQDEKSGKVLAVADQQLQAS